MLATPTDKWLQGGQRRGGEGGVVGKGGSKGGRQRVREWGRGAFGRIGRVLQVQRLQVEVCFPFLLLLLLLA